jgi:PAS domain S-box-containing protein
VETVHKLDGVTGQLDWTHKNLEVINSLLQLSLENVPLDELLERTLDLLTSIPWIAFQSKGSILLVEEQPEVLVTRAQKGLGERILATCSRVPFGRCLCGLAAATRQIQFAADLDDRHTVRYEGMSPHGHYCVPILFADRLLGVMNLYVKAGHFRHPKEEEFLTAVANTLAGIIARREAEEARLRSEKEFNLLLKNVPALVFKGYADGSIDLFDDRVAEMTGYPRSIFESRELKWTDLILKEDIEGVRTEFIRALKGPGSYVREYRINCEDERVLWIQERSQIVLNREGRIDYVSGVIFDITERRQAEDDLRRAHAEIEQLFASISSILIGLNPRGGVWHWNEEAEKVLGVAAAEAVGQKLHELPIQWDLAKISEALVGCRKGSRSIRLENVRFRRQNGKDGFLGIIISPVKGENGEISGIILLGMDVTERLIMEHQLAQAQKLESIGQLAAGIAHEINTPIQYVGDNTRFLQDAFQDLLQLLERYQGLLAASKAGVMAADLLEQVETATKEIDLDYLVGEIPVAISQSLEGVKRVAKIVRAMKDFSHPGAGEKQAVDLNKALEDTITVARNEWKYVATLVTDLDPSLPLVFCRADEINQVFLNIIVNAAHAIGEVIGREPVEKGTITVRSRRNGDWAEVSISDTGPGIAEEIKSKIFDPFFTTKEVGKGTGQGLAICHAVIVDKHGGSIDLDTARGRGATFTIRLPLGTDQG